MLPGHISGWPKLPGFCRSPGGWKRSPVCRCVVVASCIVWWRLVEKWRGWESLLPFQPTWKGSWFQGANCYISGVIPVTFRLGVKNFGRMILHTTQPKCNRYIAPEHEWLEDDCFLLGMPSFRSYDKFPGCNLVWYLGYSMGSSTNLNSQQTIDWFHTLHLKMLYNIITYVSSSIFHHPAVSQLSNMAVMYMYTNIYTYYIYICIHIYINTIHMIRWDMFFLNLFKHASFHLAKLFISYCHAKTASWTCRRGAWPWAFPGEAVEHVSEGSTKPVGGWTNPFEKYENGNLPPNRGENKNEFETTGPSKVLNKDEQKNTKDISHIIHIILLANRLNLNDLYTPLHKMRLKSIIQWFPYVL